MQDSLPSLASQLLQNSQPGQGVLPPRHGVGASIGASASSHSSDPEIDKQGRRPGKRPSARGTAFYPRKRANTACQVCRARKTKCDSGFPACSYCVSVGATCIQSPVDLSSFDPASIKILGRLDDLERILKDLRASSEAEVPAEKTETSPWLSMAGQPQVGAGSATDASIVTYPDPEPLCIWSHLDQSHGFQPARQVFMDSSDSSMRTCHVLPQRVSHILSWPTFRAEMQSLDDDDDEGEALGAAVYGALKPMYTSTASLLSHLDSDSGRIHRLLDDFFTYVHGSNPILDEVSTRRMVKETITDGIDWSSNSCLTLIICALGCLASPFAQSEAMRQNTTAHADSRVLFEASQKRIGSLLVKNDLAAGLFLSGVYMMHLFQPAHGWRFFLQALAICQSLPSIVKARRLGSTPATPPTSSELGNKYTQEQAVYWSAWKSERELREELSLPDFQSQDSGSTLYPPFFPTPPIPNEHVSDKSEPEAWRAREAWLFYLADMSLRRLKSRVCSVMLDLERSMATNTDFLMTLLDMIPDYEFQVREWRDNLPEELSLGGPSEEDGINQFVLRGKLMNFFEIIYWPFVVGSLSRLFASILMPPAFHEVAARGLDTQLTQIRINETGFLYRHHGCFFMIRSCTRSALVLLAASKVRATMPVDWDTYVLKVTRMQSYWEDEDADVGKWRSLIERELAAMER